MESAVFDAKQFRELITVVLQEANLYSPDAVELLMMTAAVESRMGTYLRQIRGPARGVFQMEPSTEADLWKHYLAYKDATAEAIKRYDTAGTDDIYWNLAYQILMARVHYLRVKEPLPSRYDLQAMAAFWKKYYNTHLGKGTPEKAIQAYKEMC
jgi:hypothetical protein